MPRKLYQVRLTTTHTVIIHCHVVASNSIEAMLQTTKKLPMPFAGEGLRSISVVFQGEQV